LNPDLRPSSGDLWGGLAAAAVLLPQAMAFGVTLLTPAGVGPAAGAYAGLIGTALICICSGMFGGTRGLISSPTGPTLVLLSGALAALARAGLENGGLLFGLALVIILTGVFQFLIGLTGGGRLIKYIPYPVVSGFMLGSAILMITSQAGALSGSAGNGPWSGWHWLPAGAAAVTMLGALLADSKMPRLPGPIAGLLLGTLGVHAVALFRHEALPTPWLIGQLPGIRHAAFEWSGGILSTMPWTVIVPGALALAVLASLDTLLTSVVADVASGARHDSRRELMGQGIGQIATGLLGGMGGAGTTAATVVAVKSGGRRWAAVAAGLGFLALLMIGGRLGSVLPLSVLAGIILYVAIGMVDRDIGRWLIRPRTRTDAAIALLVAAITVFYDLMAAVGVGVAIAVILFIRSEIKSPVVHRRSTGQQIRSIRRRDQAENQLLEQHGDRIVFYELRGNLFFATADRLLEEMLGDLDKPAWIILHMRRVARIDLTGVRFLHQIAARLAAHGGQLLFCNVHRRTGVGSNMQDVLRQIGADRAPSVLTFNGKDEALEYAEDALLQTLDYAPTRVGDTVPLERNELCRYLEPDQIGPLRTLTRSRRLNDGEHLFAAGEYGEEMFIVVTGQVDIRLPTSPDHYKRLASCGPGSFFGELGLLKPGPRAADAVAVRGCEVLVLDRDGLDRLQRENPSVTSNLLRALCEIQVVRLRWSSSEMQRLSES